MNIAELTLCEFENKIESLEEEVIRRTNVSNYLNYLRDTSTLTYEDVIRAISYLDHTTLTADEIIDNLEEGE